MTSYRLLLFTGLMVVLFGCGSNSDDSDSTHAQSVQSADTRGVDTLVEESVPKEEPVPKAFLSIQAGLVYRDGPQPVARTKLFLLDGDLKTILEAAGLEDKNGTGRIAQFALAKRYQSLEEQSDYFRKGMAALRKHVVDSTTTDFDGKAQLEGVPPGTYYLAALTETRRGIAAWNLQTEVKPGENVVVLDQDNAAVAF